MGGEGGRFARAEWGGPGKGDGTRSRTKDWRQPRKWNRQAAAAPGQTFVFCASLADVFDNAVPPEWRRDLFDLIRETPNLTWLLLTKRPGNIEKMTAEAGGWPPNAAAGVTCEDRKRTEQNLRLLLNRAWPEQPAFFFASFEPLLEGVADIAALYVGRPFLHHETGVNWLGWVITGGETDQGAHPARPANPDWYRDLRDLCADEEVPFHFKQWGEWVGARDLPTLPHRPLFVTWGQEASYRAGKERDPCTLDGVKHDARPL
jgi:protein gp37